MHVNFHDKYFNESFIQVTRNYPGSSPGLSLRNTRWTHWPTVAITVSFGCQLYWGLNIKADMTFYSYKISCSSKTNSNIFVWTNQRRSYNHYENVIPLFFTHFSVSFYSYLYGNKNIPMLKCCDVWLMTYVYHWCICYSEYCFSVQIDPN